MKDNMMDHMESMSNVSYLSAISVGAIRIVGSVLGLRNYSLLPMPKLSWLIYEWKSTFLSVHAAKNGFT